MFACVRAVDCVFACVMVCWFAVRACLSRGLVSLFAVLLVCMCYVCLFV